MKNKYAVYESKKLPHVFIRRNGLTPIFSVNKKLAMIKVVFNLPIDHAIKVINLDQAKNLVKSFKWNSQHWLRRLFN